MSAPRRKRSSSSPDVRPSSKRLALGAPGRYLATTRKPTPSSSDSGSSTQGCGESDSEDGTPPIARTLSSPSSVPGPGSNRRAPVDSDSDDEPVETPSSKPTKTHHHHHQHLHVGPGGYKGTVVPFPRLQRSDSIREIGAVITDLRKLLEIFEKHNADLLDVEMKRNALEMAQKRAAW
ncbi:hypothetical protein VTN02DRAFT_2259 [Thermoascus thermophilus]